MDASWEKGRRTRPSLNINMINILWKKKTQKPADKYFRKVRETPSEFVALVIALRFLLVNKNMELIKNTLVLPLDRDNGPSRLSCISVVPFIFVFKLSSTKGGCVQKTTAGKCCSIPFTYKGVKYHSCTTADHNQLWCSLDAVYKGKWGNCGKH